MPVIFEESDRLIECLVQQSYCSCGGNEANQCWHLKMGKDLLLNHGFKSKWLIYSAFHKSLRLTVGSRAMEWLEVLLKITSPQNIKKYLERIVLEETRSINLLKKLNQKVFDIHELTFEFMTTQKKWSHPALQRHNLIENWYSSYKSTLELIKLGQRPNELTKDDLLSGNLYQWYWYPKLTKTDDSEFWFRAANLRSDEIKQFLSERPKGSYSRQMCIDLICGLGSHEEKCATQYHSRDKIFRVPTFESTFYDLHVAKGKSLTKENLSLILANKHSKPDLRLSGQVLGVFWRIQTSALFGDIESEAGKLRPWQGTALSVTTYSHALSLDKYFYPKVF